MAKSYNQKLKLLYLARIFIESTDAAHTMTIKELAEELGKYEISSERKSLYSDIECLRVFGLDICVKRDRSVGYYLGKRDFEPSELRLLIDAVAESKFMTEKKSDALIKKLELIGGKHTAARLRRRISTSGYRKAENEEIFCNVDMISRAISENRRICFKYFEWGAGKRRELCRGGEIYCVSPWSLLRYGEEYYMIGYNGGSEGIVPYRVDKMLELFVDRQSREGETAFEEWNDGSYTRQGFGLCGEGLSNVRLSCDASVMDEMIDTFGRDIVIANHGERFEFTAKVMLGREFYSWVLCRAGLVSVVSPAEVVTAVREVAESYLQK